MSNFSGHALNIVILFALVQIMTSSCTICNKKHVPIEIAFYKEAFHEISKDRKWIEEEIKNNGIGVSKEITNFHNYAHFFKDQIPSTSISELSFDSLVVEINHQVAKIGSERKRNVIFFSNIKQNLFFAELFLDTTRYQRSYGKRPQFGRSYVYMFKVVDGKIITVNKQIFNYM